MKKFFFNFFLVLSAALIDLGVWMDADEKISGKLGITGMILFTLVTIIALFNMKD
jgi:hypothetical protein